MKPGTIIQMSDRRYIVGKHGEWRMYDWSWRVESEPIQPEQSPSPVEPTINPA